MKYSAHFGKTDAKYVRLLFYPLEEAIVGASSMPFNIDDPRRQQAASWSDNTTRSPRIPLGPLVYKSNFSIAFCLSLSIDDQIGD